MNYIELFAGIGGFRLGLQKASPKFKCVFSNEWLERPRRIYAKQFGEFPDKRDIKEIPTSAFPEADLIVGGFPCATFSIAGKRTGFNLEDTRGTLCFEMFRIARDKRIPYILFENVKGLLNHDEGRTFEVILSSLDEMGYDAQWELLDSQYFGVPQHRERLFLVANLRGRTRPKIFPITTPTEETFRSGEISKQKPDIITIPVFTPKRKQRRGFGKRFGDNGAVAYTVAVQDKHGVYDGKNVRMFTPLECERLQGLPDDCTKWLLMDDGTLKQNSDSDRYERCGRTVTINVIKAIGERLINV